MPSQRKQHETPGAPHRVRRPTGCVRRKDSRGFTAIELLSVVAIIGILAAIAIPNFLEAQVRSKVSRVRIELSGLKLALGDYYQYFRAYPPPLRAPDEPEEEPEEEPEPARRPPQIMGLERYLKARPGAAPKVIPAVPVPPATGTEGATAETPIPAPVPAPRYSRWRGALRSSYTGSWEDLHPALVPLTTPVAFITGLPVDPFRKTPFGFGPYSYFPHVGEDGEGLLLDVPGLQGRFLFTLWSYGPDLEGSTDFDVGPPLILSYDPSNGTTSNGDVLLSGP